MTKWEIIPGEEMLANRSRDQQTPLQNEGEWVPIKLYPQPHLQHSTEITAKHINVVENKDEINKY